MFNINNRSDIDSITQKFKKKTQYIAIDILDISFGSSKEKNYVAY